MSDLIQAGDTVYNNPSKETWYVLGVNYNIGVLCVAGYPPTITDISDCVLVSKGMGITDEELKYRNGRFGCGWE